MGRRRRARAGAVGGCSTAGGAPSRLARDFTRRQPPLRGGRRRCTPRRPACGHRASSMWPARRPAPCSTPCRIGRRARRLRPRLASRPPSDASRVEHVGEEVVRAGGRRLASAAPPPVRQRVAAVSGKARGERRAAGGRRSRRIVRRRGERADVGADPSAAAVATLWRRAAAGGRASGRGSHADPRRAACGVGVVRLWARRSPRAPLPLRADGVGAHDLRTAASAAASAPSAASSAWGDRLEIRGSGASRSTTCMRIAERTPARAVQPKKIDGASEPIADHAKLRFLKKRAGSSCLCRPSSQQAWRCRTTPRSSCRRRGCRTRSCSTRGGASPGSRESLSMPLVIARWRCAEGEVASARRWPTTWPRRAGRRRSSHAVEARRLRLQTFGRNSLGLLLLHLQHTHGEAPSRPLLLRRPLVSELAQPQSLA